MHIWKRHISGDIEKICLCIYYFKMPVRNYLPNSFWVWATENFRLMRRDVKYLFRQMQSSIQNIAKSFSYITNNFKNYDWHCEWEILAPKNDVNRINHQIQLKLPGEIFYYKSIDTVIDEVQIVNYPVEYFSSLDSSGMPKHIYWCLFATYIHINCAT